MGTLCSGKKSLKKGSWCGAPGYQAHGINSRLHIWKEKFTVQSFPDLQVLSPKKVRTTAATVLAGTQPPACRALPARPGSRG